MSATMGWLLAALLSFLLTLPHAVIGQQCRNEEIDLVFVLDSSGSIRDGNPPDGSYDNWMVLLNFLVEIVTGLDIGSDKTRVGVVRFSDQADSVIYLREGTDREDLVASIRNISYLGQGTNTSGGIREMHHNQFNAANGDRAGVQNVALIITDGKATRDTDRTLADAAAARLDGVRILAFGITGSVEEEMLRNLSSEPQELGQNYFTADTIYQGTFDYASILTRSICEQLPPVMESGWPRYGPYAGGTRVRLTGERLENVLTVTLTPKCHNASRCEALSSQYERTDFLLQSNSELVFMTRPLRREVREGESRLFLPHIVSVGGEFTSIANSSDVVFEYRPNPVINVVEPRATILSGGIKISVQGEHLNSVFAPKMLVHMETRDVAENGDYRVENVTTFVSEAVTVLNSLLMTALTPSIELPGLPDAEDTVRRRRRAADSSIINNDQLEFYLGFELDGFTLYENLSDTREDQARLIVYADPQFEPYGDIRMYDPNKEDHLDITGDRLTDGATEDDYHIELGKEECVLDDLRDNEILCKPPDREPAPKKTDARTSEKPILRVSVGYHRVIIGKVDYVEDQRLLIALVCGMFGSLLAAIVVTLLACRYQRRARAADSAHDDKRYITSTHSHEKNGRERAEHDDMGYDTQPGHFDFSNAAFPEFIQQ